MYRKINVIPLTVIGLFIFALLSGIFIPLYSDEAVTKWNVSRFFLEDQNLVSFFPQCSTMADRTVAIVFYPAAILFSAIYSNLGPLGIRLSGITLSIVWLALLAYWTFKQTNENTSSVRRLAGFVAFSALGILPYLLDLSRSEQFMTLPILTFCLTAIYFKDKKTLKTQSAGALLFALILSCFFYAHPKSLFFLPFLLIALWITTETYHRLIRFALLTYALILFYQVLHESNAIAACIDAPAMQAMLAANTLLPRMLFTAPSEFFQAAMTNLLEFPERVITHLTFNPVSQSGWLPPMEESSIFLLSLNFVIKYLLYSFIIGTHIASAIFFVARALMRKLTIPLALAASLSAADVVNALFFNIQNFYSGTQFLPVSVILAALLLQSSPSPRPSKYLSYGYFIILTISIISMLTLLTKTLPALVKNSYSATATLPGQPLSIPVFDVQSHLRSIEKLGHSCELPFKDTQNMVVDHMTYFVFVQAKKPIHTLYVSEYGFGGDLTNGRLLPFLKKIHSPGLISRCEWMPQQFRSKQKSDDMGYCCVNLNDF
ncbi:hypothetical protein IMF27_10975 [Pseudomonas sp. PCH199]|uniref:hypothetical protein n=1 Tax=unclassified Pseudomonas TaxID=196821 RepID=UPI000BD263E6|nr:MULTISPECIES: hypothetical protein [unclassified Pseudomonas]MCW8276149.1 hypothetical protein [Pseudomonas sp. PCH199]PAM83538.1 hypothetical protein CES87_11240 [Pseudomonas sp. ERMR1:02]